MEHQHVGRSGEIYSCQPTSYKSKTLLNIYLFTILFVDHCKLMATCRPQACSCRTYYWHYYCMRMHRAGAPSDPTSLMGRQCTVYSPGATPSSTKPSTGMMSLCRAADTSHV